ncbi:MAG: DUF1385 domain-containing protein [Pseudomonadota bacterium]
MLQSALSPDANRLRARVDVGGQAVIEGVMMRAPRSLAVAVRKRNGEIVIKQDRWRSITERWPVFRRPLLRGSVVFAEALINGLQALSFSASQASGSQADGSDEEQAGPLAIACTMILGVGMAIVLFVLLPHILSGWLLARLGSGYGLSSLTFHAVDGAIKLLFFLSYVWAISFFEDVRRLFEYHGAEHKSIFAYEAGAELTVENARKYPRLHPRCGTAFILLVMLISIVLFSLVFTLLPAAASTGSWQSLPLMGLKIVLMLPVAGVAYEIIRYCSRHMERPLTRVITAPGLWLQRLTTREPSDDQIETALAALTSALAMEQAARTATEPSAVKVP